MKVRERYTAVDWLALACCIALPVGFWWLVIVGLIRLASSFKDGSTMTPYYPGALAILAALCFVLLMTALCYRADRNRERRLKEYHRATIQIMRAERWKRPQ